MNYAEFVKAIAGILYEIDPMGLSGAPADEYEPGEFGEFGTVTNFYQFFPDRPVPARSPKS